MSEPNTVSEWMTRRPVVIRPDAPALDALALMLKHAIRHLPVVLANHLVGIVSNRDLFRALPLYGGTAGLIEALSTVPVADVMTRQPITVTSDTSLLDVARLLIRERFNALPVVDHEFLVGVITSHDITLALVDGAWRHGEMEPPLDLSGAQPGVAGDE